MGRENFVCMDKMFFFIFWLSSNSTQKKSVHVDGWHFCLLINGCIKISLIYSGNAKIAKPSTTSVIRRDIYIYAYLIWFAYIHIGNSVGIKISLY